MKDRNTTQPLTPEEAARTSEEFAKLLNLAAQSALRRKEIEAALEVTKKEQAVLTEHLKKLQPMLNRASATFV